jgi:hypothetical protein
MFPKNAVTPDFFDFDMYQFPDNELVEKMVRGLNKEQFLIIFSCPEEDEKELNPYLQKILTAMGTQMEVDTHYLNLPLGTEIKLSHFLQHTATGKILIFGIQPHQLSLNIQIPPYTVFPFLGCKWLWADPLGDIFAERNQTTRPKAAALWTALNILKKD